MVCPRCGSDHTDVKLRSAGTSSKTDYFRTGSKGWFIPSGQRTTSSQRHYTSIALCKDCGHVWWPMQEGQKKRGMPKALEMILVYFACAFVLLIVAALIFWNAPMPEWYSDLVLTIPFIVATLHVTGILKHIVSWVYKVISNIRTRR